MNTLCGILFDKDGTLLDLEALWRPAAEQTCDTALHRYAALLSPTEQAALRTELLRSVGICGDHLLAEGALVAGTNGDVARAMLSVFRSHSIAVQSDFTEYYASFLTAQAAGENANVQPTCPNLAAVLHLLNQSGLVLGLVTSDRPESARLHLQKLGILEEFAFIGADDGVHRPKPARDLMDAFCRKFRLVPSECAVVGDAPNDMRFAQNCGSLGIWVDPSGEKPLPPGAALAVRTPAELPAVLQEL